MGDLQAVEEEPNTQAWTLVLGDSGTMGHSRYPATQMCLKHSTHHT